MPSILLSEPTPTTSPVVTTPAPTRPPKRVIVVTRPPAVFRFAPGAELSTEFPQEPGTAPPAAAPPSVGPPAATFDSDDREQISGEQQALPQPPAPSPLAPPQPKSQSEEVPQEGEEATYGMNFRQ